MITVGSKVKFMLGFSKAVHVSCREVQLAVVRATAERREMTEPARALPGGKEDATVKTYRRIWMLYVKFAERNGFTGRIPGAHVPWDPHLLWEFMKHRLQTCKPTTVVGNVSALAYFGQKNRFVLPTKPYDGQPLLYRDITSMKRQMHIDRRVTHGDLVEDAVDQCCPLGNAGVCIILSSLRVVSRRGFLRLSRYTRHHVAGVLLQHSCGMRFGHFAARMYRMFAFLWSMQEQCFNLVTDWHRYSGRYRYLLSFFKRPVRAELRYDVKRDDGSTAVITAGLVLQWHFEALRAEKEEVVFCPQGSGFVPSAVERQAWLRRILLAALPLSDVAARAAVEKVSPHSFRPGLAGDYLRGALPWPEIMRLCRWHSKSVAIMYAERPSLGMLRVSSVVRRVREVAPGVYLH